MKHSYHFKSTFFLLMTFLLLIPFGNKAQQKLSYAYDNAGNRISRTIVLSGQQSMAKVGQAHTDSVFFREVLGKKQIKLFPNPVKENLTIEITGYEENLKGEYFLFDIQGKTILHRMLDSGNFQIEMSTYAAGNYLMRLVINNEASIWRIIKK